MRTLLFVAAAFLLVCATDAAAQTKRFAGSYSTTMAFTTGANNKGLCSIGPATIASSGVAVITLYYPNNGGEGALGARVDKQGRLRLTSSLQTGYVTLFRRGKRIFGMGKLSGVLGDAIVAMANYPATD